MECSEENIKNVKLCISNMISKEETLIEVSSVKLSICSPRTNKKFIQFKKEGILCVIANRNYSCLFLQLYDLNDFTKVFEIELYSNINKGYNVKDNFFHYIEFPGFFLGISFPKTLIDNDIKNRSDLIHESIISYSKFIDINYEYYTYLFNFDFEKEQKDYQNKIDNLNNSSNMSIKNKKKKDIDKEKKDFENQLLNLEEKKNLFNNINIFESSDTKVYKMISFHIIKSQNKLVKKIYKKNFENFIGTNKINYENIKIHKPNFDSLTNNIKKVDEKNINNKNFVDYQNTNIMDLLNDDEEIIDEKIQQLIKQKNHLKKIHNFNYNIKKITIIKEDNK